jgi:hypothetical protein
LDLNFYNLNHLPSRHICIIQYRGTYLDTKCRHSLLGHSHKYMISRSRIMSLSMHLIQLALSKYIRILPCQSRSQRCIKMVYICIYNLSHPNTSHLDIPRLDRRIYCLRLNIRNLQDKREA